MMNALNEFLAFRLLKSLDFLGVGMKGESLLLIVELWSINLLVASAWTKEVLGPVHVSSSTGSLILHDTGWCKGIEDHIGTKWNGEQKSENQFSLGHLIESNFESDVGGTIKEWGKKVHFGIYLQACFFEGFHTGRW